MYGRRATYIWEPSAGLLYAQTPLYRYAVDIWQNVTITNRTNGVRALSDDHATQGEGGGMPPSQRSAPTVPQSGGA